VDPLIDLDAAASGPLNLLVKRCMDVVISLAGLVLTLPLSLLLMLLIKCSSSGAVIYRHERIGKNGKPFMIFKFRSMIPDAEQDGPQLSSRFDPRITSVGRFMRRLRLDEIPNLVNVLIGDMALVGPRPERRYFIDQILQRAPEYTWLLKVKPGVTSWGQVKYGYAENIDQMIRRMKFDLVYVENMSLWVDIQILVRTIYIILQGRGI
jgi:lipopolysaccharide/colanic/teichoic acid biosynthesis glycosyltransferase